MVLEALVEHEETRLRRLIDNRCNNVVLDLFEAIHKQTRRNVQAPLFAVMEDTVLKDFFTETVDELLDDKMDMLTMCQDCTKDLIHHLIKSSTFTMTESCSKKQQSEKGVAGEAKFRQYVNLKIAVGEEITPISPLKDCFPESSKTPKDDKQEKTKDKTYSQNHSNALSSSKCGSSRHSEDYKFDKDNEGLRKVKFHKPGNTHLTESLEFNNCRLQKRS